MKIFTTTSGYRAYSKQNQKNVRAFVPTMGALHNGHLSLVQIANQRGQLSIVSLFVNPTQFNNSDDLDNYPRTYSRDIRLLKASHCDILYLPSVSEVYPKGYEDHSLEKLVLNGMDEKYEGEFRPGHFKGVLQVVKRLLDIVEPNYLIMGQKDYQQFSLIGLMLRQLNIKIDLIVGPTVREKSGLAMSSRNMRLTDKEKDQAIGIYKTMVWIKDHFMEMDSNQLKSKSKGMLTSFGLKPEYIEFVHKATLEPVVPSKTNDGFVILVAAWMGNVRLIDNYIVG